MKSDYQIIMGVRRLINKPEKWCQGSYAKDEKNDVVSAYDKKACKFCAVGAFRRYSYNNLRLSRKRYCIGHIKINNIMAKYFSADKMFPDHDLVKINDRSSHKQIMDLFSAAAKKAKANE